MVVALAIYGDLLGDNIPGFAMTTYVVGGACGLAAAIFLLLSVVLEK